MSVYKCDLESRDENKSSLFWLFLTNMCESNIYINIFVYMKWKMNWYLKKMHQITDIKCFEDNLFSHLQIYNDNIRMSFMHQLFIRLMASS